MGPVGLAKHFGNKMMRVWAMGDDDGITNAQYAYQYPPFFRYFAGKQNAWFMIYMQAFRIAMLFLNVYAYVCGRSYVFYAVGSRQAIQYMLYRSVSFTHGRRG